MDNVEHLLKITKIFLFSQAILNRFKFSNLLSLKD